MHFVKAVTFFALALTFVPRPAVADEDMAARVCPDAAPLVAQVTKLSADPNTAVDQYIDAARGAAKAFGECAVAARVGEDGIESVHYNEVRAAQLYVIAGRLARLTGRAQDARDSLQAAVFLSSDVADYVAPRTTTRVPGNAANFAAADTDAVRSPYHDAALDVRKNAQAELNLALKGSSH